MTTALFQRIGSGLAAVLLALSASAAGAAPVDVRGVRIWSSPASTRVVFDLSGRVRPALQTAAGRVVVDVPNARFDARAVPLPDAQGTMKSVRVQPRAGGLRISFDVAPDTKPATFIADPNARYGWRLVVDLKPGAASMAQAASASTAAPPASDAPSPAAAPRAEAPRPPPRALASGRDLVIAVDAGHGGVDPGATGKGGTREKDVTLAIARALAARIDAEPGMRAVLTRDGDYFVELRDRMRRARAANADLFVSVHADAVENRDVAGSSVYILSARGASNEAARRLAERENAADLVGGVKLSNKDPVLASVLLDLSQSASMAASQVAAEKVLAELNEVGTVRKARVQQAGFVVLKSPDVPSMLIETAYITNPGDERRLRSPQQQRRLADAILTGIRAYFRENPPPGTRVAATVAARTDAPSAAGARTLNP
jgi:N-acetylmuramoyl-L-alanine amidase